MAPLPRRLKDLCTPALVYLFVSIIGLIVSAYQNMGNTKRYFLGTVSKPVTNTLLVFMIKIVYVLFWTWILNLICNDGHKGVAWFLVLIPFLLLFSVVFLVMANPYLEGATVMDPTKKGKQGSISVNSNNGNSSADIKK